MVVGVVLVSAFESSGFRGPSRMVLVQHVTVVEVISDFLYPEYCYPMCWNIVIMAFGSDPYIANTQASKA
jgi:hypothetical protein